MKNPKNLLIATLLIAVVAMSVGYAVLAQNLNINGTASISSSWNVKFSGITNGTPVGGAINNTEPTFTGTTATFDVSLVSPGDSMTYNITVSNNGSLDAVLDSIVTSDSGSSAIIYTVTGVTKGDELAAGEDATVVVKVEYDSSITQQPDDTSNSLTVTLNYVQKTA